MKRLIYVPQLPVHMRYQDWFITEFESKFKEVYDEVIVLGKDTLCGHNNESGFAPVRSSIYFEEIQINHYLNLPQNPDKDDTLFLADLSFPGLFTNILYHKKVDKMYAFCHATSKNAYDYFQGDRSSKWNVESGHAKLFNKVFVATEYHQNKLGWLNTKVVGLPMPPFEGFDNQKEFNLISVCRDDIQKHNITLEKKIEKKFGKIIKKRFNNWNDYYEFISKSKIMIITSKEETFGYQVVDAIINGCIPIAPYKFSYPELLPSTFLYDNDIEHLIEFYLDNPIIPKLKNQNLIDNFYNNIIGEMNE